MSDSGPGRTVICGVAVFASLASALLLFVVQPMMGRFVLPEFGGSPGVWTACLLFYQAVLLAGYAYAAALSRLPSAAIQWRIHAGFLVAAAWTLGGDPMAMVAVDSGTEDPTWPIVVLLARVVGVPYLALSATSPLLSVWSASWAGEAMRLRMYAASNVGSLLGLWIYPLYVELAFPLASQLRLWGAGFLFVAPCVIWVGCGSASVLQRSSQPITGPGPRMQPEDSAEPDAVSRIQWFVLSACASGMLLATSNLLCLDVAPVPLLWIMPLTVYLASYVCCFLGDRFYPLPFVWPALLFAALLVVWTLAAGDAVLRNLPLQIGCLLGVQWLVSWVCHGELHRARPRNGSLAEFYLWMASGGVAGSLCVSLVAPRLFPAFYEFYIALVLAAGMVLFCRSLERVSIFDVSARRRFLWRTVCVCVGCLMAISGMWFLAESAEGAKSDGRLVAQGRGFYGTLRTVRLDAGNASQHRLVMVHGTTVHGFQYQDQQRRALPTGYFAEDSGIGLVLRPPEGGLARRQSLAVGVVGLGAGALAAYAQPGDAYRFYEINPLVIEHAEKYFSFLGDARSRGASIQVVQGDGRVNLRREHRSGARGFFDVLVMDAFNGDSVPVHLLTRESMELYWEMLKPEGVLAVQVTNRHLRLTPVVRTLAAEVGKECVRYTRMLPPEDALRGIPGASAWILVSSNRQLLDRFRLMRAPDPWDRGDNQQVIWTDDRNSIVPLIRAFE